MKSNLKGQDNETAVTGPPGRVQRFQTELWKAGTICYSTYLNSDLLLLRKLAWQESSAACHGISNVDIAHSKFRHYLMMEEGARQTKYLGFRFINIIFYWLCVGDLKRFDL